LVAEEENELTANFDPQVQTVLIRMAGVMMKRILKIVVGSLVALLVGLALLGLAKSDRTGIPAGLGGQTIVIDGVNIRYAQKGAGRDVLPIHGTPSSLEEWLIGMQQ
jgi:hypothetical protein